MKKFLFFVVILFSAFRVSAYDFEVDGFYYNLLSTSDLTCEITSGDEKYTGDIKIPSTVIFRNRELTVTSIGERAFEGCSNLASIEIPGSVTSIDSYAFRFCSSLVNIELPSSVTSIDGYAFSDCSRLVSIELPNSLMSIGFCAFSNCSSLIVVV